MAWNVHSNNENSLVYCSVYGRVSQISAMYLFLYAFYAILRCISFKIRVNFLIELLRIYKTMVLTSFFDFIQAPSMRISLILHLNFAHIKPQQPNPVILVTILAFSKAFDGNHVNFNEKVDFKYWLHIRASTPLYLNCLILKNSFYLIRPLKSRGDAAFSFPLSFHFKWFECKVNKHIPFVHE